MGGHYQPSPVPDFGRGLRPGTKPAILGGDPSRPPVHTPPKRTYFFRRLFPRRPEVVVPAGIALRVLQRVLLGSGCLWVLAATVELERGIAWIGLWILAAGVLIVALAPFVGRTHTDLRLPRSDRGSTLAWAWAPAGAVVLVVRALWLLGAS